MRRLTTTDGRSAGRWAWGVFLAIPAVGLFLAGKVSSGWISTASFLLFVIYVFVGLGYGLVVDVQDWGEMDGEFEPGDCTTERENE